MHQNHHDALLLQVHRHALPDAVEGGFGGTVGVGAAGAVVGYGADTGGHEADAGGGREEVREEGLRRRRGAKVFVVKAFWRVEDVVVVRESDS